VSAELERTGEIAGDGSLGSLPIRLRLQACDDRVCLQPEDLVLRVPVAAIARGDSAPF
jgi:hypothetical protein